MLVINEQSSLQLISENLFEQKNIKFYVLREDLIHPEISGNKWRKLKYNVAEAKQKGASQMLTFGGAYSNHIAATAAAGQHFSIKTIGIIRGEEILPLNPTLQLAKDNGMRFIYVSREVYRKKTELEFLQKLKVEVGDFYLVPEGGSNALAVKGCTEILNNISINFDVAAVACGTGGTISGLIASADNSKEVLGFPALKGGSFLKEDIQELLNDYSQTFNQKVRNDNWELIEQYHFGGYAKVKDELVQFVKTFYQKHKIPLDLIYTGKMFYGFYDMIENSDKFNNKTIVVIHTGGLQGNKGFEERLGIQLFLK
ncbi:pyridoxal-phosphate dependent enzyme [bacterium]|nr:pyridoxal-phosphate dependent enzyme [bacterium]